MSKVEIYYFSGTGNSLAVARDIAQKFNAKLIGVNSIMNQESINSEADVIGFVFPIYDFKPPKIIDSFICKLKNIDSKYLFAVCTYGLAPSRSLKHLNKLIKSCGGNLSGGFVVGMPHNGIGSSVITKKQHEKMFMNWNNKLVEIYEYISNERNGKIESSILFFNLFQSGFIRMVPSLLKFLMRMLFKGTNSLTLASNKNCNGCGICNKVCPVNNIEITKNKPIWSDHCAGCFACLHWCPKEAISIGGVDMNIKIYHHPDVNISDMI